MIFEKKIIGLENLNDLIISTLQSCHFALFVYDCCCTILREQWCTKMLLKILIHLRALFIQRALLKGVLWLVQTWFIQTFISSRDEKYFSGHYECYLETSRNDSICPLDILYAFWDVSR